MHTATKLPPARERAEPIHGVLKQLYPEPVCALTHENALQLLVATILSAQCTDARVNTVTPALFARFKTARDFAEADPAELQGLIKPTGFYKNKAKLIQRCCKALVERFSGEVPGTLDELVALPGVGRKTANVILGDAFDTPGITVDTHVGRLSRRLGLTRHRDPVKVEFALMQLVPQPEWSDFSHRVILHGRQVCHARKPRCESCPLANLCPKVGVKALVKKTRHKDTKAARRATKKAGSPQSAL